MLPSWARVAVPGDSPSRWIACGRCLSGGRTGAASNMHRVGVFAAGARFPHSGPRMDLDGWPLIMGDDPGVPDRVRAMTNRRFKKLQTEGDSACAIHALVGSDASGVLRHADARRFLRRTLGETADEVRRRCRNFSVLDDWINWAWKMVIKPQAKKTRRSQRRRARHGG